MYINIYLQKRKMSGFRQNVRECMDFIKVLIHDVCIIVCIVCEPTAVQDKLLDYRKKLNIFF